MKLFLTLSKEQKKHEDDGKIIVERNGKGEVIYPKGYEHEFTEAFGSKYYTYRLDEWMFTLESNREKLQTQFQTASLKGFGIDSMPDAIVAAGAILYYLEFTEHRNIRHIASREVL